MEIPTEDAKDVAALFVRLTSAKCVIAISGYGNPILHRVLDKWAVIVNVLILPILIITSALGWRTPLNLINRPNLYTGVSGRSIAFYRFITRCTKSILLTQNVDVLECIRRLPHDRLDPICFIKNVICMCGRDLPCSTCLRPKVKQTSVTFWDIQGTANCSAVDAAYSFQVLSHAVESIVLVFELSEQSLRGAETIQSLRNNGATIIHINPCDFGVILKSPFYDRRDTHFQIIAEEFFKEFEQMAVVDKL